MRKRIFAAVLLCAVGCGPSAPPTFPGLMDKWSPRYVQKKLGPPATIKGPFEGVVALRYKGISFVYAAREGARTIADVDRIKAVVVKTSYPPRGSAEFTAAIPANLKMGMTLQQARDLLGTPDSRDQKKVAGVKTTWLIYNERPDDWRHYWLRFDDGILRVINISRDPHPLPR